MSVGLTSGGSSFRFGGPGVRILYFRMLKKDRGH
jgi:hypothetical protein